MLEAAGAEAGVVRGLVGGREQRVAVAGLGGVGDA